MRGPGHGKDVPVRKGDTMAVVGAGTMGGGIARSCADFGMPVRLLEVSQEALDKGMARIRKNYEVSVQRGSLAADEMERRFARIQPVTSYDDIADCDAVIEAVFEQMDVKKEVFAKLDRSEEHTSELQSLMRISYAVFCLKKKKKTKTKT